MRIPITRFILLLLIAASTTTRSAAQSETEEVYATDYKAPIIITYNPDVLPLSGSAVGHILGDAIIRNSVVPDVEGRLSRVTLLFEAFDGQQEMGRVAGQLASHIQRAASWIRGKSGWLPWKS